MRAIILILSLTFFPLQYIVLQEYVMVYSLFIKKTNQLRIQGRKGGGKGSSKIPIRALSDACHSDH